jgi:hypothetical protein
MDKAEVLEALEAEGLPIPSLYAQGFQHNNCAGACVKAGQASWRLLLKTNPERYAFEEAQEEAFRQRVGKDVSILKDRRGYESKPLTLRRFRQEFEETQTPALFDPSDWGSCSCLELETVEEMK